MGNSENIGSIRIIVFTFILSYFATVNAQESINCLTNNNYKCNVKEINSLKNGECICENAQDGIKIILNYKNDTIEGTYLLYRYGNLRDSCYMRNGIRIGKSITFYDNKKAEHISYFDNKGKLIGRSYEFDNLGFYNYIIDHDSINSDSIPYIYLYFSKNNIMYQGFYPKFKTNNSKLLQEYDGYFYYYDKKNNLIQVDYYSQNQQKLNQKKYLKKVLIEESNFNYKSKKMIYNGSYTSYYKKGNIKQSMVYESGKINGKYEYYYPSGSIKVQGLLINNEPDGDYKEYSEKGDLVLYYIYNKGRILKKIIDNNGKKIIQVP